MKKICIISSKALLKRLKCYTASSLILTSILFYHPSCAASADGIQDDESSNWMNNRELADAKTTTPAANANTTPPADSTKATPPADGSAPTAETKASTPAVDAKDAAKPAAETAPAADKTKNAKAPQKVVKKAPQKGATAAAKGGKKPAPAKPPQIIKSIFITSKAESINKKGRPEVVGIHIDDLIIPYVPQHLSAYLCPFIDQKATPETLKTLTKAIDDYFKGCGSNISLLVEYTPIDGILQVLIIEKRVGKITFEGQKWFSEDLIAEVLDVHTGDPLDQDELQDKLQWLNSNAFHKSIPKFTPSKVNKGAVDFVIKTEDRFPLRFTLTGDNTGTPSIGKEKFDLGVSWGNAFWRNDVLNYDYSTSNFVKRLHTHTASYVSYLPWQHKLSIFGNYTISKPAVPNVSSTSHSNQLRVRYQIPFKPLFGELKHSTSWGFDLKYSNANSLNLTKCMSTPSIKKGQISQLVGNYTLSYVTKEHNVSFDLNYFWSPGEFFPHQSKTDFNAKRQYSRVNYAYFNINFEEIYTHCSKFALAGSLKIQKANRTLPPTELFFIGGYNTVRGYKPNALSYDNGLIANLELRTPPMTPLKDINKNISDQLYFLCFIDYGVGYNFDHTLPITTPTLDMLMQYALGSGLGLRYQIKDNVSIRCDYGWKLHHLFSESPTVEKLRSGSGQVHVGVLLSY